MLPVFLSAVAATLWGTGDFVGGVLTKRLHVLVVVTVAWAAGLVLVGAIAVATEPSLPSAHVLRWGLAGGVVGAIGLGSLYQGLSLGRMGIVAPIAAMSVIVPVVVGFGQGDRPAAIQVAGMALAVIGALLAATAPDPAGRGRAKSGLGYAVLAAVFIGLTMVCLAAAGADNAAWGALLLRVSSLPIVLVAALATRVSFRSASGRDVLALVGIGAADNGGNVLFAYASAHGLLALVSVVASLVPVATALWARFLLHERLTRHQLVGVALALAGVAMIAAG
ncbi:MAG: EamA family transporter [Planctomycetaceae bacterium]